MSDNESSEVVSGSGRFDSAAKMIGFVGGLIAVLTGIHQLWTSNVQNARELQWKQASMAREIVSTMMSDDGWQAFEMMDWDDKGREYTVNGEVLKLNAQSVYDALEHDESTDTDHFIIDRFDRALFLVSQLEAAVRSGLVRFDDVRWPLSWYASERMCPRKQLFEDYMRQNAAPETLRFFERLEEWQTCRAIEQRTQAGSEIVRRKQDSEGQ